VQLREYQIEAIEAVKQDWESGHSDVLVVVGTGGGKTQIFLQLLIDSLGENKRGLILAHRQELIDQPLERIEKFWPEWFLRTGVVMAERDEVGKQLVIGSVQTLSQQKRLARVLAHGPIDYVVHDEAHHVAARSHMQLLRTLKEVNPNLRHLGVTATPLRSDGDGLAKVYQKVSYKAGIRELIKLGFLVPFKALGIQTTISVKGIKTVAGDFNQGQLKKVYEVDNAFDLVVASHQQYAADRKAMAFTVSVEGAHRLAEKFNEAGISAAAADGTTSKEERMQILARFRQGKIQVLCNCFLWVEGLDLPEISCIHQVRPTQSDLVYVQMIGRSLRIKVLLHTFRLRI